MPFPQQKRMITEPHFSITPNPNHYTHTHTPKQKQKISTKNKKISRKFTKDAPF